MSDLENFTPKLTADGSFTFVSEEFGESFHSHYGAQPESFFKFVEPTQLATAAQKPVLRLLDVCYGLGYNTAAAVILTFDFPEGADSSRCGMCVPLKVT